MFSWQAVFHIRLLLQKRVNRRGQRTDHTFVIIHELGVCFVHNTMQTKLLSSLIPLIANDFFTEDSMLSRVAWTQYTTHKCLLNKNSYWGAPGWLSLLSDCLRLRSWSWSPRFESASGSLLSRDSASPSDPSASRALSLSFSLSQINKQNLKKKSRENSSVDKVVLGLLRHVWSKSISGNMKRFNSDRNTKAQLLWQSTSFPAFKYANDYQGPAVQMDKGNCPYWQRDSANSVYNHHITTVSTIAIICTTISMLLLCIVS